MNSLTFKYTAQLEDNGSTTYTRELGTYRYHKLVITESWTYSNRRKRLILDCYIAKMYCGYGCKGVAIKTIRGTLSEAISQSEDIVRSHMQSIIDDLSEGLIR